MLRMPRPVCERLGRNSSLKGFPQYDSPPGTERSTAGSEDHRVLAGCSQQDAAWLQKPTPSLEGHLEGSPGPEDGVKGEGHTLLLTHVGEGVGPGPSSRQVGGAGGLWEAVGGQPDIWPSAQPPSAVGCLKHPLAH